MEKKIDGLRWQPRWVSHLGCIKGCLDYLNLDVSEAWLFGATGHAFIINIHEVVCPSGPTAWNTQMVFRLGRNIGYAVDGVHGFKTDADFSEKQRLAWESTRKAIDDGLPCYGWELDIPEYYVVFGYDEKGYYFSGPGCESGKGPKPWNELADTGIGVLEMFHIEPCQAADDTKTIREALDFVLEHAESPSKWVFPKYKAGLKGFDTWIDAVERRTAHDFGMAYNAAVWTECRSFAVKFLQEAKERIDGDLASLFDQAAAHYEDVEKNLREVTEAFPFPPRGDELKNKEKCDAAAKNLRAARAAEQEGLSVLEAIKKRL